MGRLGANPPPHTLVAGIADAEPAFDPSDLLAEQIATGSRLDHKHELGVFVIHQNQTYKKSAAEPNLTPPIESGARAR